MIPDLRSPLNPARWLADNAAGTPRHDAGREGNRTMATLRTAVATGLGALAACVVLLGAPPAGALTLDWDVVNWPTTGTRTQTYAIGGGNVTLTFTDPLNRINGATGPSGSPASLVDGTFLNPTGNAGASNLFIKTLNNTSSPWVRLDITFSHVGGVTDVDFSIFDVDRLSHIFPPFILGGYEDQLTFTASDGVTTFNPTSVTAQTATPSWSFNGTNTITGTANVAETGGNSANGTANVSFDQVITSFSITYRNTLSQGQSQWIGLSALRFRIAPEPSTGLLVGLGVLALAIRRSLARR
jgi:hypothetical protein